MWCSVGVGVGVVVWVWLQLKCNVVQSNVVWCGCGGMGMVVLMWCTLLVWVWCMNWRYLPSLRIFSVAECLLRPLTPWHGGPPITTSMSPTTLRQCSMQHATSVMTHEPGVEISHLGSMSASRVLSIFWSCVAKSTVTRLLVSYPGMTWYDSTSDVPWHDGTSDRETQSEWAVRPRYHSSNDSTTT